MTETGVSHRLEDKLVPLSFGHVLRYSCQANTSGTRALFWHSWPQQGHFQNCCLGVPVLPEQFLSPVLIVCVPKQGTRQRHDDVYQITRLRKVILTPEQGNESS